MYIKPDKEAGDGRVTGIKYSFVIPVHNEEGNLIPLMGELINVRNRLDGSSEVIFIDDGSTDNSRRILEGLIWSFSEVIVVDLLNRSGQSAALMAGINEATGKYIITMDADLQNDPNDLLDMQKYCSTYQVVIGRRIHRKDDFVKRYTSIIANKIRKWITGDQISDTGCSLRIIDANILRSIPRFNGMHRFIPTLCRQEGASVYEVSVSHRGRIHGNSHYGTWDRALRTLIDAFVVRWMETRRLQFIINRVSR